MYLASTVSPFAKWSGLLAFFGIGKSSGFFIFFLSYFCEEFTGFNDDVCSVAFYCELNVFDGEWFAFWYESLQRIEIIGDVDI